MSAGAAARGLQRVVEEHGDGHGADAAGDGGDEGGHLAHAVEVDVPDEALALGAVGVRDAVDADVDDDGAWADHLAGEGGEVAGMGVAEGHGGVAEG